MKRIVTVDPCLLLGGWGGINYVVLIQYAVTPTRGLVWLIIFSLLSSSREKKPSFFSSSCRGTTRGRRRRRRSVKHKVCFHPFVSWVWLSPLDGEFSWRNAANAICSCLVMQLIHVDLWIVMLFKMICFAFLLLIRY